MNETVALANELDRRFLDEVRKGPSPRRVPKPTVKFTGRKPTPNVRPSPKPAPFKPIPYKPMPFRPINPIVSVGLGRYPSPWPVGSETIKPPAEPNGTTKPPQPTDSDQVDNAGGPGMGMDASSAPPPSTPTPVQFSPTCATNIVLGDFESGDYRLRTRQFGVLRQAVRTFQAAASNGPVLVSFVGHASAEGSEDMNEVLAFLRAAEVKWVFTEISQKLGISSVTFQVKGRGEKQPAVAGNSAEARKRNRRVEVGVCQASS